MTDYNSDEYARFLAGNKAHPNLWGGKVRSLSFTYDQGATAGDADDIIIVGIVPASRTRFLTANISNSAFGASRELSIGLRGVSSDGAVVDEETDGLAGGINIANKGTARFRVINREVDSETSFYVTLQVTGGNIPVNSTLEGFLLYTID